MRGRVPAPGSPICIIEGCGRSQAPRRRGLCQAHCGRCPCAIEGCSYTATRRGLCHNHYAVAKYAGQRADHPKMARPAGETACRVGGCTAIMTARGYRARHYERYRTKGTPLPLPKTNAGLLVEYLGRFQTQSAWARELGLSRERIRQLTVDGKIVRPERGPQHCSVCGETGHYKPRCGALKGAA